MTIIRHYLMTAAAGRSDTLGDALRSLGDAIGAIAGCEGIELLQDTERPERFLFIERWASIEAHKDGAPSVPKDVIGAVMGALDGRPDGAYFRTY